MRRGFWSNRDERIELEYQEAFLLELFHRVETLDPLTESSFVHDAWEDVGEFFRPDELFVPLVVVFANNTPHDSPISGTDVECLSLEDLIKVGGPESHLDALAALIIAKYFGLGKDLPNNRAMHRSFPPSNYSLHHSIIHILPQQLLS